MPRCLPAIGLTITLLCAAPLAAQDATLLRPVDEASSQAEFFGFRARLQTAVAARDVDALLAMSSPNIKLSFGGDDGSAAFRRQLASDGGALFARLAETLALGGSFRTPDQFVAPYTYSRWPEQFDAFSHFAVVGERVAVRASQRPTSEMLSTVSWAIVTLGPEGERDGMTQVELPGGRYGWIATRFLRSPVDYRALFVREGGRWQLAMFVAGD